MVKAYTILMVDIFLVWISNFIVVRSEDPRRLNWIA